MAADYMQMLQLVENYYGSGSDQWLKVVGAQGATADELLSILQQTPGVETLVTESGQYAGWRLAAQESYGAVSNVGSLVNSNTAGGVASVQSSGLIQVPGNFTETAGTVGAGSGAVAAASGASITAVAGTAIAATLAVSTGISLGKKIDKAIYEGGQALGFSAEDLKYYDPDAWGDISLMLRESGLPAAEVLFNVLFDVDPSKQTSQMYIDENAYAYMAYALQQMGVFERGSLQANGTKLDYSFNTDLRIINTSADGVKMSNPSGVFGDLYTLQYRNNSSPVYSYFVGFISTSDGALYGKRGLMSESRFEWSRMGNFAGWQAVTKTVKTLGGKTIYSIYEKGGSGQGTVLNSPPLTVYENYDRVSTEDIATIIFEGTISQSSLVNGVSDQQDAKLPDLSTATNAHTALGLLKQQYPELWEKVIYNDVLQPDGTVKRFTYIPVPTPTSTGKYDLQPTGDGSEQNQKNTDVLPSSSTAIKDITTTTITSPPITPNPPDTGEGDSPTIVTPVGKASSLWSIYNPTLEQVNQFGSWLWSSNFVEQLKKLFSDPMQAIIGLHKVYSPVQTSGQGTIKCGYLDSEVPSKLVSEQYITVDCGSVDLQEYFGNVFDYPPYTEVSIYLPFIGIRQLDPSDVMRSTISVKYHIDVLTGACLAEVNVQRDAAGGTLYTFSGDAAVRYPVSSGSYMGIVSGLIGVATSVVSGNLLPALGGVTSLHTNVDRSGSFTGNAGAMGSKIPYLIISRPQTAMADQFETLSGYPSNTYTPLSACKGFTQVKYCHVENLNATDAEKQEIERLLKEGVIL